MKRNLWRRNDPLFLRPQLQNCGKCASLHVRLLHENELLQVETTLSDQSLCERDVLASVGRVRLDQNVFTRRAKLDSDAREPLRLGFVPKCSRNRSLTA